MDNYNIDYIDLLKANTQHHLKVRTGRANYTSYDYKELQARLLQIELSMSAAEIIRHHEYLYPAVGAAL